MRRGHDCIGDTRAWPRGAHKVYGYMLFIRIEPDTLTSTKVGGILLGCVKVKLPSSVVFHEMPEERDLGYIAVWRDRSRLARSFADHGHVGARSARPTIPRSMKRLVKRHMCARVRVYVGMGGGVASTDSHYVSPS